MAIPDINSMYNSDNGIGQNTTLGLNGNSFGSKPLFNFGQSTIPGLGGSSLGNNSLFKLGQDTTSGLDGSSLGNNSLFNYDLRTATDLGNSNGLANSFSNNGLYNPSGKPTTDDGFMSRFLDGDEKAFNTIRGVSALGSLGLGLAGFLSSQKMAKKQGELMDQQIANNTKEMARRDSTIDSYNKAAADAWAKYGK
jgi:hypothetical protein